MVVQRTVRRLCSACRHEVLVEPQVELQEAIRTGGCMGQGRAVLLLFLECPDCGDMISEQTVVVGLVG